MTTLGIESLNLSVEPTFHSKISAAVSLVLHLVAVVPLIPGKVVELEEKTSGPALARSPEAFLIEVALLELLPMLGEKALEEVLPTNGGLGSDDLVNIVIREVGKGERVVAPSVKAGEQRLLEAGVGAGFLKIGGELGDAFVPHIVGTLSFASKHMSGVFGSAASGALVIILVFPFDQGFAHPTV